MSEKQAQYGNQTPVLYENFQAIRNILSSPQFVIPTETEELANLIYTYSYNWAVVLAFFGELAKAKGLSLDTVSISQEIHRLIGEE